MRSPRRVLREHCSVESNVDAALDVTHAYDRTLPIGRCWDIFSLIISLARFFAKSPVRLWDIVDTEVNGDRQFFPEALLVRDDPSGGTAELSKMSHCQNVGARRRGED